MKGRQRRQAGQTWTRPGQNPHEAKRPTAPCPWRGQAGHTDPDKAWTRPGQEDDARQEDSSNTKGRHSSQPRPEDGRNTRGGHPGFASAAKGAGGHEKDSRRTPGQEEDAGLASVAKGQQEDNSQRTTAGRTRGRQDPDTSPDTNFRGAASQCDQLFFSYEKTPTVNCLGGNLL